MLPFSVTNLSKGTPNRYLGASDHAIRQCLLELANTFGGDAGASEI